MAPAVGGAPPPFPSAPIPASKKNLSISSPPALLADYRAPLRLAALGGFGSLTRLILPMGARLPAVFAILLTF